MRLKRYTVNLYLAIFACYNFHTTWFIIPHAVATLALIADLADINEGNFGTPIAISLMGGIRPFTDVIITFMVSGNATGKVSKTHDVVCVS